MREEGEYYNQFAVSEEMRGKEIIEYKDAKWKKIYEKISGHRLKKW